MALHRTTVPKVCFYANVFLVAFDLVFGLYSLAIFGAVFCVISFVGWHLRARGY